MTWQRRFSRLIAVGLLIANPLLHKPVSDACDWVRARWGFAAYDRTALVILSLATLAPAALILARGGTLRPRRDVLVAVLALVCLAVAAQRWLLVANIELIHFPQYALMSGILLRGGASAPAAFALSTAAGVVDEAYQHFVVYADRQDTYFDVNDIVLNAIGAAWGVIVVNGIFGRRATAPPAYAGSTPHGRHSWRRAAPVFLGALALASWWDPPQFVPLLRSTISGHAMYRVLSAAEGIVVLGVLWGLTAWTAGGDSN